MFLHNTSQTHDKENVWTCAWSYYSFFAIGKLQKRNKKICLNKAKQTILFLLFFPPQKSEVLRMTHLFVLRLLSVLLLSKSGLFLLDSLPTIISPPLLLFFHPSSVRSVILFSLDRLPVGQHSDGAPDRKNPHSWLPLEKTGNQDNPILSGRVSLTESGSSPFSQSAAEVGWLPTQSLSE